MDRTVGPTQIVARRRVVTVSCKSAFEHRVRAELRSLTAWDFKRTSMTSAEKKMVLYTIENLGKSPTPAEVADRLGIPAEKIDPAFGIVMLDPARDLYCVQIPAATIPENLINSKDVTGPWETPEIHPVSNDSK